MKMNILTIIIITGIMSSMFSPLVGQIKYPEAKTVNQVDDYFGTKVPDPYRWLEDDNSEETKKWVTEENKVTQDYLSKIPFRDSVKKRLEDMWNFTRYGSPFKKGDYYYYYKNDGLQNQSVLYRVKNLQDEPEVFINPNSMSSDGTVVPGVPVFTKDAKYCAFTLSRSGSDWQEAYIMDVQTKKILNDTLNWLKFSGIAWKGDEGFYYSRYSKPDEKTKLLNQNQNQKIYFHKIGAQQSADELIFEDTAHPLRTIDAQITEDEHYLILNISEGTSGEEILVKDLHTNAGFTLLVKGFDTESSVTDNDGDNLLVRTNADAPNYKVVSIDPKNPARENWQTIIPTRTKFLESASTAGGKLFLTYLEDATSRIYQCNYKGNLDHQIELPGIGSAGGFSGMKDDKEIFYTYTSFNCPTTIYRYNIITGKSDLFKKPDVKINPDDYVTVQSFFKSKDGVSVPMFITYKRGIKLDGNNPTLIYGYGGFNIPMTPFFSIATAFFLEQGGVFVLVNLRGGNEYGEEWHKEGMLLNKQNVFNDVFGAVNFLIDKKYTNPQKIALRGGSNGGLMVGACMTQHPELFKVAIPEVGVMDMLRYHLFTIGWAWATEYGKSDKKEDFENLYKYSPLHNLKKGVTYPATLITTADHDDRVVPGHSFKFAATLQADNDGTNPTLIRIESKAGHGGGMPMSKVIAENADIWSFVMYNLGMNFK